MTTILPFTELLYSTYATEQVSKKVIEYLTSCLKNTLSSNDSSNPAFPSHVKTSNFYSNSGSSL